MQVIYEGAAFEIMRNGGVARYFTDLIDRLPQQIQPTIFLPRSIDSISTNPRAESVGVQTSAPLKCLRRWWRPRQHDQIASRIEGCSGDLVHWTYYTGLCRRPVRRGAAPIVITVYDFIHEAFPQLDPSGQSSQWKQQAIEAADHICCISHTTHQELCERFPAAADRSSVTLLGNTFRHVRAEPLEDASIAASLANRPYVLFVGRRSGYKNFDLLLEAWGRIRQQTGLSLVLVGPPMKLREQRRLGIDPSDDGIILVPNASDAVLKGLYQQSRAFVFPSRCEGFGLPAVEAMETGAPLLASSCAALTEVAGDAAHYFDPDDVDGLADLLSLATDNRLPNSEGKIEIGRRRAAELTWSRTVEQTLSAYQIAVGRGTRRSAA